MANYNKVIIAGFLCRDPEIKYTPKGVCIAVFTVAVNRTWKKENGEEMQEVAFIDCTAFGRQGEVIGQYFKKGKPIMVEGRLRTETWEDKQTQQKRSKLSVIMESFQFMESGQEKKPDGRSEASRKSKPDAAPAPQEDAPYPEDDVPF